MSKRSAVLVGLCLLLLSLNADAAINNAGILDSVLARYSAAASGWAGYVRDVATRLFWTLALISMIWTFGQLALRKAELGEFFAEFIKFTVFTGFFWWLLTNGPNFATSIYDSLRQIAGDATGLGATLTPSGVVDIGFEIFNKVLDQSSIWSPVDSIVGITIAAIILVILALVGVNMLLLLVSGWILAYGGIFFLGFGGSRWTSEMAVAYYKTVLGVAAQLMSMVFIVGIGKTFLDDYYTRMSAGIDLSEMGVMLIVAVILFMLVNKIPPLIASIAGTNLAASSIGNFGGSHALAAAGGAAAAAAVGGAMMKAGAAEAAGGAQALMAAVSKAQTNVANDSDVLSFGGGKGGGGGSEAGGPGGGSGGPSGGGSDYAQAAGYADAQGMTTAANDAASAMRTTDSQAGADAGASSGSAAGSADGDKSASGPGDGQGEPAAAGGPAGGESDAAAAGAAAADATPEQAAAGSAGAESGKPARGMGSAAGYAGRVAADAAANLAKGTGKVAMDKARAVKAAASERIANTVGGKIATAIRGLGESPEASDAGADPAPADAPQFEGNSVGSAASSKEVDAAEEIAAFRDRGSRVG